MGRAIIMGVAGAGKSLIGTALAGRLGALYLDGDDLHPAANIAKMSVGVPLTDADRAPWLGRVGEALQAARGPIIISCSALKRPYRDIIRSAAGRPVLFIHLTGSRDLIADRMAKRAGHFMPASLLDSQFAALQPLQPDEAGRAIKIDQPAEVIVAEAADWLTAHRDWTLA